MIHPGPAARLGLALGLFAGGGRPATLATAQAPEDPAPIAIRGSRIFRSLQSIRADFHQVIEDRMIGTQESHGELFQAGESKLVMRFREPKGDAIVLDGTHVWVYTPSTTPGQVIRSEIPTDPVYGPNVLARILDRPVERYRLRWLRADTLNLRTADAVEFVPNVADPLFGQATIWFDRQDGLPRRLELQELSGLRRTLDLTRVRVNVTVPAGTFAFKVPPGVRIIEP